MRYRPFLRLAAAGIAALGLAAASHAQVTGYTLVISSNANVPTLQLTNNADPSITLTGVTLTIGNTAYNYDAAYNEVVGATGIAFTRLSPDNIDSGSARADFVQYSFTGFDAGETFQFDVDVDIDSANTTEDYRVILFNNGTAPNAQLTVNFSNGGVLTQTLEDQSPNATSFTFSQTTGLAAPEPGTLALLGLGALPIAGAVIRRRGR